MGLEERARRYIRGLRAALQRVDASVIKDKLGGRGEALLDAVRRYTSDAEYFLNKGDYESALAAASYAEGLLDSLKYLGVFEPEWPSDLVEPVVFVGGTFDIVHPGHIELLKYAASMGRVIVTIARDSTVERIKGRRPLLSEEDRLKIVNSIKYVYKARLGDPEDPMKSIEAVRPDIIVLGPDQGFDEEELARIALERTGKKPLIVRFKDKVGFSEGMKSVSDIIKKACRSSLCRAVDPSLKRP